MRDKLCGIFACAFLLQPLAHARAGDAPAMKILKTPTGEQFALFGAKRAAPAPTLFVFATGLEDLERSPGYTEIAMSLAHTGFFTPPLDPPRNAPDPQKAHPHQ